MHGASGSAHHPPPPPPPPPADAASVNGAEAHGPQHAAPDAGQATGGQPGKDQRVAEMDINSPWQNGQQAAAAGPSAAAALDQSGDTSRMAGPSTAAQGKRPADAVDELAEEDDDADGPPRKRVGTYRHSERHKRITRSRKVNSCLQCRAKKQKCDRQHPMCGNCQLQQAGKNGAIKGEPVQCTYVDGPLQVASSNASAVNALYAPQNAPYTATSGAGTLSGPSATSGSGKAVPAPLRDLVRRAYVISRTPGIEFSMRVKAARSAVVGWTLASHNLSLPSPKRAADLMEVYERHVAWYCAIVLPDLVAPRLQHFLKWFHDAPTALPADPPFIPLALTLIALALQAIRTTGDPLSRQHLVEDAAGNNTSGGMADAVVEPSCSTERHLLEIAGRCIDGLQLACPSAWASAYQAPIDLVKASLLRSLWHLNEQHVSFAGTGFGVSARLAYAAGLHRDPKHWSSISREEAQARRNLWWNVVYFETTQSIRNNTPSSITPGSFDTELPSDYDALKNIYDNAIRHQQHAALLSGVPIDRPYSHPPENRAKGLVGFFSLVRVQLQQEAQMQRANRTPSHSLVKTMSIAWDSFRTELPQSVREPFDADTQRREQNAKAGLPATGIVPPETRIDDASQRVDWLQRSVMQLIFWHGQMTIHRPYADEEWKKEARGNLEKCLVSAQCITWLVSEILRRDPPFVLISLCSYHIFAAGVILSIFIRVDPRNDTVEHLTRTLEKAITCLDTLSRRQKLGNVSEQAQRYAAALKEMVAQHAGQRKAPPVAPFEGSQPVEAGAALSQQVVGETSTATVEAQPQQDFAPEIGTANLELLGQLADATGGAAQDPSATAGDSEADRAANALARWMSELDGSFTERPFPGTNYNYAPGPNAAAGVVDPSVEMDQATQLAQKQAHQQQASSSSAAGVSPAAGSDISFSGDFAQNWTGWERFVDSVLLQNDVAGGGSDFISNMNM